MDYRLAEHRQERERRNRLGAELTTLQARLDQTTDESGRSGLLERISNLSAAVRIANDRVGEIDEQLRREAVLVSRAASAHNREAGTDFGAPPDRGVGPAEKRGLVFDEAQRQLERMTAAAELTTAEVDRLDRYVRNDQLGVDTRYVAAVSQPEYATAFGKLIRYGDGASLRMTDDEREAVQQVMLAEEQRSMAEATLTAGGYALPPTIDPTMRLMSNGAINPIRSLAEVRTISTLELRLLATDGVVAAYAAEGTEASDNSPVLAQPDLFVERFQAFVPVSFELLNDWNGLQTQLARLFSDAKDVMEASAFLTGGGHSASQPAGIVGGVTGSLTTSQQVLTNGAHSVSTHDIYNLRANIPPRFLGDTSVCVSPAIQDILWNLVPRASTTDNILMPDREHILEFNLHQWSTMAAALTTGNIIAIAGDFNRGYVIADRIGLTIELIPHLFGTNRRPTGQRGFYLYGRNSGVCVSSSDNAPLRYLQTS
jgi:HK97 family phage major capsid protein